MDDKPQPTELEVLQRIEKRLQIIDTALSFFLTMAIIVMAAAIVVIILQGCSALGFI